MNREAIYSALFATMEKIAGVRTSSRRLRSWTEVEEFPAIFQAQKSETGTKSGRGVPTKWDMYCELFIYTHDEPEKLASQSLNEMLDLVEQALASPNPIDHKQTLGGLVHDCWIDGQITTDEGTLGENAVAIVPIHIITS